MDCLKPGFWIALGSGLGGATRFALDQLFAVSMLFPLATFFANICGSFLIGYLVGRWSGTSPSAKWHFSITGFCGGFTTFSAFSWQLLGLVGEGHGQMAGIYAASSVGLGIIAVYIGMSLARGGLQKAERL